MKNLNEGMEKNTTIIFFLTPDCRYCNELKPTLDSIDFKLQKSKLNGIVAKVYDNKLDELRYKKEITGFPTISIFKNGKYTDYKGSRDEKTLTQFLFSILKKNKIKFDIKRKTREQIQIMKGLKKGKKILDKINSVNKRGKQSKRAKRSKRSKRSKRVKRSKQSKRSKQGKVKNTKKK